MLEHDKLTDAILAAAIDVHKALGPGLLESAYEQCLCYELSQKGLAIQRQVECPLKYKEVTLDCGFRIDIMVEGVIILEIKAFEKLTAVHETQLLTYLKLANKKVGFLMNFNTKLMKDGIMRRVL